jgi:RNA-directed DNA polymerase
MWLKTPVEERDERGNRRMSGGKRSTCGTPQGGVASPMLANVYMNRFLKYWRSSGRDRAYRAHVVSYADDFVILSRGHAEEAREFAGQVMTKLGLTLNEEKTSVRDAREERFDFLGYTFGPHLAWDDGHWYLGASPFKEEPAKAQAESRRDPGSRQPGAVAGSAGSAEQLAARLEFVLQLRLAPEGLPGGRQPRLPQRTVLPETAS